MNVWTDIAIGNLQRQRPPPVPEGPLYACTKCGEPKPEEGYYMKSSRYKDGSLYRQKICRDCTNEAERAYRAKTAPPPKMTIEEMVLGALSMGDKITSEIVEATGEHRRSVDRVLRELLADGQIEMHGFITTKYHPRVMKYRLTQARPGAGERNAA